MLGCCTHAYLFAMCLASSLENTCKRNLKPVKISRDDSERCHPRNQFWLRKCTSLGEGLLKLCLRGSLFNPTDVSKFNESYHAPHPALTMCMFDSPREPQHPRVYIRIHMCVI